jgi:hypothetical protein
MSVTGWLLLLMSALFAGTIGRGAVIDPVANAPTRAAPESSASGSAANDDEPAGGPDGAAGPDPLHAAAAADKTSKTDAKRLARKDLFICLDIMVSPQDRF